MQPKQVLRQQWQQSPAVNLAAWSLMICMLMWLALVCGGQAGYNQAQSNCRQPAHVLPACKGPFKRLNHEPQGPKTSWQER